MPLTRVLVADDHEALARHVIRLLSAQFEVLGPVRDGQLVVEAAANARPDVVLLDLSMPHVNGLEVLGRLKRFEPALKIIVLTMYSDRTLVQEAIKGGAAGYVSKSDIGQELLPAFDAVLGGRSYVARSLRTEVEMPGSATADPATTALTAQQQEVLRLLVNGRRAREIASVLDISIASVAALKDGLMRRLGVQSTAELVQYTIQHRLIAAP